MVAGSRKVCIVDDDDGVRNSVRRLLEADDFETTGYASGADFLSHYHRGKLGCLILDMNLPGMSGSEICRSLRAHGTKTPILALSASVMPNELEAGLRAGFDAYLTKPITPVALREAIRRYAKPA